MKHRVKFRDWLMKKCDRKEASAFNDWMEKDKFRNLYLFVFETESVKMVKNYMLPNSKKKAGFTSQQMKHVQAAWKMAVEEICQAKNKKPADVRPAELEDSQTLADALDDIMQACGKTLDNRHKIFLKSKEYKKATA